MAAPLVIVGAGSSGAVIAARVSEAREVLLLEAGPDYGAAELPRDLVDASRNSMIRHDWGYRHRPTTVQMLFPYPRGRVVGGSSAVNTCIALRGQPYDYEEWQSRGLADWSWEQCLPAFKRLERDLDFHNEWHGRDGPLPIRRHPPEELVVWQAGFLEACRELGLPECLDSNAPNTHGFGPHAMNKLAGRRISVAEAYLTPEVRSRPTLKLSPLTSVRRVLLRNRKVVGVEVVRAGRTETIAADEVVLCAGAIDSPAILLRSGVGPRDIVERLGIELVYDLPAVGARLLDHPGTAIFLRPRFGSGIDRRAPLIQTVLRYGSGEAGRTNDMILQPGSKVNLPRVDLPLVSLMCSVGKPGGLGRLTWSSIKPRSRPTIESLLLEHPDDRRKAVEAMALAHELAQTSALRRLAAPFWPSARTLTDRAHIDRWIRRSCDSGYHPCGTVPMGADRDPAAATDGRGHVRGITGLRVADASLMPTIPSANTNLTVLMMGERFGEWLRRTGGG